MPHPPQVPTKPISGYHRLFHAPLSLRERLSDAPLGERAAVLLAAVASGERIELPGADLRGVRLCPRNARRAANREMPAHSPPPVLLDGINLAGATLSGASLAGLSLRGACLDKALLVGADLRRVDLTGASLRHANLTGARVSRADLSFADLRGASLLTADLTEVTATGADFRETLLQSAVLVRALLRTADLRWAHLNAANLREAELDGARFEGAVLALANLTGARLTRSTDFSYAFLHHARFDRTSLSRAHLGDGIGEAFTHLALARDTYRALRQLFETAGRRADARWAHLQAWRMETATHRPDGVRRYHVLGGGASLPGEGEPNAPRCAPQLAAALFHGRHTLLWLLGLLAGLVTGYGTSLRRITATLLAVWLLFALVYHQAGAVIHLAGNPVGWLDTLRYSAAALTPVDAYPLVATTEPARAAAALEGTSGILLLGALGYVAASRIWRG